MPVSILIADDHTLFREMLRQTLSGLGDSYTVIGEAADGDQTLNLVTRHRPDVLLLDYRMPGLDRLSTFCCEVGRRNPTTRTLLVTGFREEKIAVEAAIGGVRGYLLKGAPISDLLTAIGIVHAGGIWVDANLPRQVFQTFLARSRRLDDNIAKLTRQELKILTLLAHGMRTNEIGSQLHISQKTVKNHLTRIYSKLKVTTRQEALNRFFADKKGAPRK